MQSNSLKIQNMLTAFNPEISQLLLGNSSLISHISACFPTVLNFNGFTYAIGLTWIYTKRKQKLMHLKAIVY